MIQIFAIAILLRNPVLAPSNHLIADYSATLQESRIGKAQNFARQVAEKANGGLSKYRAEPSMFGDPRLSPYRDNGDGSWSFTFLGGTPGSANYSIESVVTISRDFSRMTLDYNGPIRSKINQ